LHISRGQRRKTAKARPKLPAAAESRKQRRCLERKNAFGRMIRTKMDDISQVLLELLEVFTGFQLFLGAFLNFSLAWKEAPKKGKIAILR